MTKIRNSQVVSGYLTVVTMSFLVALFVRICGTIITWISITVPDNYLACQFLGLYDDLVIISYITLLFTPLYFIFFLFRKTIADSFALIILVLYTILEILLVVYFGISQVPLSYQIFEGVTSEQINQTVEIYGFQKWQLLLTIPVGIVLFVILWKLIKILEKRRIRYIISLAFLGVLILSCFFKLEGSQFESEVNFQAAKNKIGDFTESYFVYQQEQQQLANTEIDAELETYYRLNGEQSDEYFDYPFYSQKPLTNPLGPFFPKSDTAPNVVFIICESLGKQFSGDDARLGSFTPFLDSLADESLYWSNFMSNAERTFGALPNLLAGVPEGKTGFMNLRFSPPDHLSLPQLLKENNGYQTAFFCGAIKQFDHMDEFLMAQKFDLIKGKTDFNLNQSKTEITDAKGNTKLFNWGAEDAVVFNQSFDFIDSAFSKTRPYFNVYLTTSFHEPFNYSDKSNFLTLAKRRIESMNLENASDYFNEIETFAALMYMDFSLKKFFEKYQKRKEFENTIFVICGDHSIKFMSNDTRIEKFHVPLLIYSPMLIESNQSKAMACHKDVPSAIQALLKENFNLKMPTFSISQSDNLKVSDEFSTAGNNHVLMYADKRMNSYVWQNYLYMDELLFKINDNLKIERIEDKTLLEQFSSRIRNYRLISNYVCSQNKYLPDSIYTKFNKAIRLIKNATGFEKSVPGSAEVYDQNQISSDEFFSGKSSLTNNTSDYLTLIKGYPFQFSKRLRLTMKFYIKSSTNEFPAVVIFRNSIVADKETELEKKSFLLNDSHGNLTESEKSGWYYFECGYWFDFAENDSEDQKIGIFLFAQNHQQYFIDDLQIELQEF